MNKLEKKITPSKGLATPHILCQKKAITLRESSKLEILYKVNAFFTFRLDIMSCRFLY